MNRGWIILPVAAALLALALWPRPGIPGSAPPVTALPRRTPPPPPAAPAPPVTLSPASGIAAGLADPGQTAAEDVAALAVLFEQFRREQGEGNPVGDNAEIVATLQGRNSKRLAYLPPLPGLINHRGELSDRWGTPYFFHALSGTRLEIRSAGPDRELHTPDDVVAE